MFWVDGVAASTVLPGSSGGLYALNTALASSVDEPSLPVSAGSYSPVQDIYPCTAQQTTNGAYLPIVLHVLVEMLNSECQYSNYRSTR